MPYLYNPLIKFRISFCSFKMTRAFTLEYCLSKAASYLLFNVNCRKMAFENYNSQRFIYLADDDSDDREFFADALSEIERDVILKQAPDGMHLMESLLTLSREELPEFIFLDINMPRKTGFECLEEIRSLDGGLRDVIIVILSTSSDPDNIQKAMDMGATFYAVKPSCFERLKSLLEEVLSMDLVGGGQEKKKFLLV
jgi:CheY-like chemotaxis protein